MTVYSEEYIDELIKLNGFLLELNDIKDNKITILQNRIIELENAMIEINKLANSLKNQMMSI